MKVAIVQAQWHEEITSSLMKGAVDELRSQDPDIEIHKFQVPGSWELVYASRLLFETQRYSAIIPIGILLKGATFHFEYISEGVTQGLMRLNLKACNETYSCPIIYGVLNVCNLEEAKERAGMKPEITSHNHGTDWAKAALIMAGHKTAFTSSFESV